jgi:hypothetical protein
MPLDVAKVISITPASNAADCQVGTVHMVYVDHQGQSAKSTTGKWATARSSESGQHLGDPAHLLIEVVDLRLRHRIAGPLEIGQGSAASAAACAAT